MSSHQSGEDELAWWFAGKWFCDREQPVERIALADRHSDRSASLRTDVFSPRTPRDQRSIMSQDRLLELLDHGAGLDTQFVDEQAPCLPVHVERLCLSSGAVERQHELRAQRLAVR